MSKNKTKSKPPSVEEPREEGLDETTCSEVWITHTGRTLMIGVGDEIGHVMWSTASMRKSFSAREPVLTLLERHPKMKKIVVTLLRANAEQLNLPNVKDQGSAARPRLTKGNKMNEPQETQPKPEAGLPLGAAPCYAATWIVHTPSGAVPACNDHAGKIQALMSFMGAYMNITPAAAGEECSNCINESKRHNVESIHPESKP